MNDVPLIETRRLGKSFGGVRAVQGVDLRLARGEVVAILGHNGAGKSTLTRILSGVEVADQGEIIVDGKRAHIGSPRDAQALGIETIHQTLALADNLDAVANLFLGRERARRLGFLDQDAMEHAARQIFERLKLRMPAMHTPVRALSGGQRQAVAIARALHFNARVLIMDEPTAALGPEETARVGALIQELSAQGIGIFLISHDIHDVFALTDRLVVMKGGQVVATCRTADVTQDEVLEMIILGRRPARLEVAEA